MQNRLRKETRGEVPHPFQSAKRSMSTSQGRYTFYTIIICAIIGMTLYKPIIFLVQKLNPAMPPQNAANLANLIAIAACVVLLMTSLLKMQTIMAVIDSRRLVAFNQRMEKRKDSDNSNG